MDEKQVPRVTTLDSSSNVSDKSDCHGGTAGASLVSCTATAIWASFAICPRAKQAFPLGCLSPAYFCLGLASVSPKLVYPSDARNSGPKAPERSMYFIVIIYGLW